MTALNMAAPARPLRVCLVVPYDLGPEAGGVKQHALHLMAALQQLGDEVWLIGPSSQAIDTPGITGFRGVLNVRHNGSDNQLGLLVSPRKIWQFFQHNSFDVIHIHEPQSPLLPYWATWLTPKTAHVVTFHAYAEDNAALWGRKLLGAGIFAWIHRAIAVSPSAARYAAGSWKRALTVIPNGVCAKVFRPPDANSPAVPQDGPLRLMFVGRLADSRKGARFMLDAYKRLLERKVAVTLDIVGATDGYGAVPRWPGITFLEEITTNDLARRYRDTDVLVAPATGQESFGIILLEAMASAKPVVCSDIDGYRGVITSAGAVFVPPRDSEVLAEAIAKVAAMTPQQRHAMGQANLQHVQQFDWDHVVHAVRAEYFAAIGLSR